ncbi:NAD(P)H-binding protein [Sciscionella marina]|uniref:NAD(P)H-binding protein n=1 Tax=Sciscionella marina TaxID=508770 RepID=UPI00037AFF60|nr:NAD(P)H-binding protein [Sciscionella marina]
MTILVTGATGNIGRILVDKLIEQGAENIRALTKNPRKAALPDGVEVAEGYLREPETLPKAFAGVERMYLAPTPDMVAEVLALARAADIGHIVDLSGEKDGWWGSVTLAVEKSGIPWTHLSPGDFMENTTIWAEQIDRLGEVREPYPDGSSAPIAMADIAEVAATALLGEGHIGESYPLTGPETLRRTELLEHIGAALGRRIPFVTASSAETAEALRPVLGGQSEWYVQNILDGFVAGAVGVHNDTFSRVTGKAGTRFADWALANAEKFRG